MDTRFKNLITLFKLILILIFLSFHLMYEVENFLSKLSHCKKKKKKKGYNTLILKNFFPYVKFNEI